jgi:hypothetical protein
MRLTIGMATYRDFDGVYFSLNALRLYHADVMPKIELVVVDNDPDGPQGERLRGFLANIADGAGTFYPANQKPVRDFPQPFNVQYVGMPGNTGTSAPRDHIFKVATGDAVLVIDSHVLLWPESVSRLLQYYQRNSDTRDLLSGPLVLDNLAGVHTHFADTWRDGMWGTWDTDRRGTSVHNAPFEIPAQGLGLFTCRRDAWLGFNPHFREFGGEELVADPVSYPPKTGSCGSCQSAVKSLADLTLEQLFEKARSTKSDINEHCDKLRELAAQADSVVEFGMRHGVSTVALLAGQPRQMISYDLHQDPMAELLKSRQGATAFSFVQGDSLSVDIEPCDLLFIDTRHTAAQLTAELERHARNVRRRIVLHDTQIFGERGEDGGPGLLVALRAFLKANPEWSVIYHTQVNHGLTVISRDKADKPALPGRITMATNLARAVAAHVADGLQKADAPELQRRLETCSVCELRNDDRCTVCGCYLAEKASWRSSECPLGKWNQKSEASHVE